MTVTFMTLFKKNFVCQLTDGLFAQTLIQIASYNNFKGLTCYSLIQC